MWAQLALILSAAIQAEVAKPPPTQLWWRGTLHTPTESPAAFLRTRIRTDTKSVRLRWTVYPAHPDKSDRLDKTEDCSTRFWPTHVETAGANAIFVAGLKQNGHTVIELWQFEQPELVDTQAPDAVAGQAIADIARLTTTTVLDQSDPSKAIVAQIERNQGAQNALFVRFWPNGDLWTLDVDSGGLEPVASTVEPLGGALHIPELANFGLSSVWSDNHSTHGYVYVWFPSHAVVQGSCLVLMDTDRDGTIDEYKVVSDDEHWGELGLGDASNYVK